METPTLTFPCGSNMLVYGALFCGPTVMLYVAMMISEMLVLLPEYEI